jgi:hypothetical protein
LSKRKKVSRSGSISIIAARLQAAISTALLEAKSISALRGIMALVRELESLGINVSAARIKTAHEATLLQSALDARKTARSYSAYWKSKAVGNSIGEAARAADTATNARLKTIGVTESSKSYNAGRESLTKQVREPKLYRVYDAVLDKRTCAVCESNDGDIVGLRERFRHGEPGTIHPNCRCTWSLLSEHETGSGYLIEAA